MATICVIQRVTIQRSILISTSLSSALVASFSKIVLLFSSRDCINKSYFLVKLFRKIVEKVERTRSMSLLVSVPNLARTFSFDSVASLTKRTVDGKSKPASFHSFKGTSPKLGFVYLNILEVIWHRIMSGSSLQIFSDPRISAGRGLDWDKSVKGKGTRTTLPGLKSVIDGVFRGKPVISERFFRELTPSYIFFVFQI